MRTVRVFALMCSEDSGGFDTGIATETKVYTEAEFNEDKFEELIEGIKLIDGCCWWWTFDWITEKKTKNRIKGKRQNRI